MHISDAKVMAQFIQLHFEENALKFMAFFDIRGKFLNKNLQLETCLQISGKKIAQEAVIICEVLALKSCKS